MKKNYKTTFDLAPLDKKVVFEDPEMDMETALKEYDVSTPIKDDDQEKKPFKRRSKKKKKVDLNEVYSA